MSLTHFLATRLGLSTRPASRRKTAAARPRLRPMLEALEDRWVPSTLTVTTTADSGTGSLRYEIGAAKASDTIEFNIPTSDPGYNSSTGAWTITLTSGEMLINHNITVQGLGASQLTVSGGGNSRVFEVAKTTKSVTLSGLTLDNGDGVHAAGSSNMYDNEGGAILNWGTLTVNNCTLSGNSASQQGGGAIENRGTLTVTGSTLSGNSAHLAGGGAIDNLGNLTVSSSTLSGNTASVGGAISSGGTGTASISGSTLSGNSARNGGAIWSVYQSNLTVSNCTFTNNSAVFKGGAISLDSLGSISITGSIFGGAVGLGNSASEGGAIFVYGGSLTLSGCTVSYNAAVYNVTAQAPVAGGGIYIASGTTVTVENYSTIINNTAPAGYGADVYNLGTLYQDSTSTIGTLDGNPAEPI